MLNIGLFSSVLTLLIFYLSNSQCLTDDLNSTSTISFEGRAGFVPSGYEEVTSESGGSIGAIEKCGEGASKGVDLCVPYYRCDGDTKTIIEEERTDGFGLIDIRFGEDKPCDHYLDICCAINKNGEIPSSSSEPSLPLPDTPKDEETSHEPSPKPKPSEPWTCGIRNDNGVDFKITGNNNHESEYGEFPWMVAIVKTNYNPENDKPLVCGGSLIAPNVVLTAAHYVYKYKSNDLKVRVGEWDTQTEKERLPYQERNIKGIIIHEEFQPKVLFNDIALIILDKPVEEAENVGTICLPQNGEVFYSKNCIATGWGKDKFGTAGIYQAILKKIELPIVPNEECQERLRQTRLGKFFVLDESFICAGGKAEQDTCTGDGGSPLVCPDPNQPHRYIQAGIVAWGIGCGYEIPAVYANVAKFRNWIDAKIQAYS